MFPGPQRLRTLLLLYLLYRFCLILGEVLNSLYYKFFSNLDSATSYNNSKQTGFAAVFLGYTRRNQFIFIYCRIYLINHNHLGNCYIFLM